MINDFYVDVEMSTRITRIQVEEIPEEQWYTRGCPQFRIDYYHEKGFNTLVLELEQGRWYDCGTRYSADDYQSSCSEPQGWDPEYKSPLSNQDTRKIGQAIANHMVVKLTARVGLYIPVFPNPGSN